MTKLPTLFISHVAPTFALDPGVLGQKLGALGRSLPKPRAVLVMSPHWMTDTLAVQTADHAPTVHDFGGFPAALYRLDYPAPTAPDLAAEVLARCQQHGIAAVAEANVGRDHGTWVPLLHLYPDADVPVIQLSLPATARPAALLALGQALSPLREQGVLIIGSGSMTHNLYERGDGVRDGYAQTFADWVAQHAEAGEVAALLDYRRQAPFAVRAHPTDEHFLPLFFALGAAMPTATPPTAQRIAGQMQYGVISMDSLRFDPPSPSEICV